MSSTAPKPRIFPAPILVVACLVAALVFHLLFPIRFLPDLGLVGTFIAVLLCLAALGIGIGGVREFHRHDTPTNPFKATTALVTGGVFRYTRNPMYLGFVLLTCGIAVGLNSVAFLVAAFVLAVLLQVLVIGPEERMMAASFGGEFESYRRRTRRWF